MVILDVFGGITLCHVLCFIMDSVRRFFANFQKHGTISWSSDKKGRDTEESHLKKAEGIDKDVLQINSAGKIQQENSTEIPKDFGNFQALSDPLNSIDHSIDGKTNLTNTSECLEEFDEILKDINKNMNTEPITLDDVDDVLTSLNDLNVTLNLETPRFDLHDLAQNFGLNLEEIDIEPTITTDFIEPANLDEDIETINLGESFVDELEVISNHVTSKEDFIDDVISISSEDSQVEPKPKHKEFKDIQELKNVRLDKETSMKNIDKITDKQNLSEELNLNSSEVLLIIINGCNNDPESKRDDFENMSLANELKTIAENDLDTSQDITSIIDSDFEPNDEFKSQDEPQTISHVKESKTIAENNLDVKSQDLTSIIDSDFEPNDEFKSQNEPQAISQVIESKTIAENDFDMKSQDELGSNNIEFKNQDKLENENDKNHKLEIPEPNPKSGYDSDDCGYQSSDFEFITEDEAKLDGLIINYNPKLTDRIIKPKQVKTIEISVDKFSKFSSESISPVTSLEDSDFTHKLTKNNEFSFELQLSGAIKTQNCVDIAYNDKNNTQSLRNFRRCRNTTPSSNHNLTQGTCIDSDNLGQKNLERNGTIFDFAHIRQENGHPSNFNGNSLGLSYLTENRAGPTNPEGNCNPRYLEENCLLYRRDNDQNDLGWNHPEPIMGFNRPRSRALEGNCDRKFADDIHRWRAFQQSRNQFILDQSYRENHVILTDEDYYQLFNPDHMPRHQSGMENKSTLTSTLLMEYGIGFANNMQMAIENIESEDENIKEEATVSAKIIMDMYPGENRKKRRRF